MDGNQHYLQGQNNIRHFKGVDNEAHLGSNLSSLEETLRDLINNSNGVATKSISGDNILTGGPPPAKPFPDALPVNLNKTSDIQVPKTSFFLYTFQKFRSYFQNLSYNQ